MILFFCTKTGYASNVNIEIEISDVPEGAICFVKEILVEAPDSGFTRPIKDVIVFFSQELVPVEEKKDTDDITFDAYTTQLQKKEIKYLPDAFLTCKFRGSVQQQLKEAIPAKFVHLKLLSAYSINNDLNIDMKYFCLRGFIIFPE